MSVVYRAPFDFIINVLDEQLVVLGAVAACGEPFLDKRITEILSMCKIIGAYPVLVTKRTEPLIKDIL